MVKIPDDKTIGVRIASAGLLLGLSGGVLVYVGLRTFGLVCFWLGLAIGFSGALAQFSGIANKLVDKNR